MRASDGGRLSREELAEVRMRVIRSWAGLVIAIGGCVFAIVIPEKAYMGFVVALIGAGFLDAKTLLSSVLKK